MTVQNWAGQRINVGAVVWRGARDGNTSSFKIGKVVATNPDKETATVQWLFGPGYYGLVKQYIALHVWRGLPNVQRVESKGSPGVDTLTVVDVDLEELGEYADRWKKLIEEAKRIRDSQLTRS